MWAIKTQKRSRFFSRPNYSSRLARWLGAGAVAWLAVVGNSFAKPLIAIWNDTVPTNGAVSDPAWLSASLQAEITRQPFGK